MSDTKRTEPEEMGPGITLEFDDGTTQLCDILGGFPCDGEEYLALVPRGSEGEVYLYGYRETGEDREFSLVDIGDDDVFRRVSEEFTRLCQEEAALADLTGDEEA